MVDNDDLISLSPMRDDLSVINFLNDLLNNGKTTDENQKVGFGLSYGSTSENKFKTYLVWTN